MTIAEIALTHGCTERQMLALEGVIDSLEKEFLALHMQIVTLRASAHCGGGEHFERYADTVLHTSNGLLTGLRDEHKQLAGILGKKIKDRLEQS